MRRLFSFVLSAVIAGTAALCVTACRDTEVFEGEEVTETETMALSPAVEESEPLNEDEVSQIIDIEVPEEGPGFIEEPEGPDVSEDIKVIEEESEPDPVEPEESEPEPEEAIEEVAADLGSEEPEKPVEPVAESVVYEPELVQEVQEQPVVSSAERTESVPKYTYSDISATMYTTAALNVRTGPSTGYNIIGTYAYADTVTVTGVCNETGWSRVDFNGQTGYCSTDYLTDTKPVVQSTAPTQQSGNNNHQSDNNILSGNSGTTIVSNGAFPICSYPYNNGQYMGRARIPALGINVGLYNSYGQWAVDAWDSAAFFYFGDESFNTIHIADHASQTFSTLYGCYIGATLYIDGVDGKTYTYVCDRIDYNGYNTLHGINWANGSSASTYGGLICYTCNPGSDVSVTVCHFYPV